MLRYKLSTLFFVMAVAPPLLGVAWFLLQSELGTLVLLLLLGAGAVLGYSYGRLRVLAWRAEQRLQDELETAILAAQAKANSPPALAVPQRYLRARAAAAGD